MKACESPAIAKYLHADDARLTGKLADYGLRNAMVDTLVRHGRDVRSGWERLLVSEHAAAKVDLLSDACRAATFLQRRGFELGPEKRYVDCYHEISAFALVTSEGAPLRLTLTCRLPYAASGNESLTLRVNGERIAEYPLNRRWSTEFVYVPAYYVRPGLNRVELCWPPRSIDGSVQIAAAVAALERGQMPATVAVTGQIEQFVAERFDGHDGKWRHMKTAPDWAEFSAEALDSWAARRAIGTHELVRIAGMLAGPRRADLVRSGQMQCPRLGPLPA